jgi:acetate kinase
MLTNNGTVLVINAGSSSIKFGLYVWGHSPEKIFYGEISRIGLPGVSFTKNSEKQTISLPVNDYPSAITFLTSWLEDSTGFNDIQAIGHRVVHGMERDKPAHVTPQLITELKQLIAYDPDHLPYQIQLIDAFAKHVPEIPQVVCFDTAFHHTMPRVAQLMAIPRRFEKLGVRRYGFHGLSYDYLMHACKEIIGEEASKGRIILAHLGNGASLAAVYEGKSIDTSMGFTPASGIPMSTRSGDIDPGAAWMMMKMENLSPGQFNHIVNNESGLLGVSETSGDMNDLLSCEASDVRAAEAIALFCYQVKKYIGALTAVLGGVDTLVFTGGIGENSSIVRARICEGLGFLGIELDEIRNGGNKGVISAGNGKVDVHIIHTNEDLMIAKLVYTIMDRQSVKQEEY